VDPANRAAQYLENSEHVFRGLMQLFDDGEEKVGKIEHYMALHDYESGHPEDNHSSTQGNGLE
jgi:hypothetical protein